MTRRCTVCAHEQRTAIDKALLTNESNRHIATRANLTEAALRRHKANHLPVSMVEAHEAEVVVQADDLLAQVTFLQARTLAILSKAEAADNLRVALVAIAEARRNLELLGKLAGELQQEGTINITANIEWIELRTLILTTLAAYPDARARMVEALNARA